VNRKQFLVVLLVLLALGAAAAAVLISDREGWRGEDARVGQKLMPSLKLADVAEIAVRDASSELHIARGERGWGVRERADFPADVERVRDLLLKAADLKAVQAEPLAESQRARLQLVEPKEKGAKDAGTALELKDAKGAVLAKLLLGKKIFKRSEVAAFGGRDESLPSGRYVVAGGDAETMLVVPEPFTNVEPRAELWLAKELLRAERVKTVTSIGGDRRTRWTLVRDGDNADWKFAGSSDKPDLQKATDAAGAFGWMDLVDVVVDPQSAETGLARAITVRADTFDGLTYTVRVGSKVGDNYYVAVAVAGDPPRSRVPEKGETADDKAKKDKAFAEDRTRLVERLERERRLDGWRYVVGKNAVELLLRDRAQMLPEKKTVKKS
jgi:uncharacterized protein DUF4340